MELTYVVVYVADPVASVEHYVQAYGLARRFVHESGNYAEVETGDVTLGFASHELGRQNLPGGFTPHDPRGLPQATELAFSTDDVQAAVDTACAAGAQLLRPPAEKPWGQTLAYVRDPDGVLIEISTPIQ